MFKLSLPTARWFRAIISLILIIIFFIGYPAPAIAQQDNRNIIQVFLAEVESVVKGRSQRKELKTPNGRPRGGAGRGRCPALISLDNNEIPLTAFVPTIHEQQVLPSKMDLVWGKTIEAYPTFWFYIPYAYKESEIEYGKFVLLNQNEEIVAGPILVRLPEANQPSLAKFTLPKTVEPLEEDQEYNWYFSIICNPLKPSNNPGVVGWIERMKLPVLPPNNSLYYAKKGIWYDTVTRLFTSEDLQTQSQGEQVELLKYIFKDVIEKPEKGEKISESENLDQIVNKIVTLPVHELIPVPNPISLQGKLLN
ncbi:DUF928 domain-containing protein [Nostoc sp. UCD121]|uniref:DUF928 domain-containing protein n=1 Tax=unclassified Nostoc TaxID=2593658 RepID=UPI0016266E49|nr:MULTISPECIES: DUF928 domain-containing protein [unclassified Nostoc]MBC1225457.1 DUF928 domain-containing protein [Nostoc sp. UCD120]MBC1281125.1 DUF928 domain-containing protein [Nostoc sp. UCD121]MBC1298692.1 DUF928 domain-containing protein [Nostoc sp. UCD122]